MVSGRLLIGPIVLVLLLLLGGCSTSAPFKEGRWVDLTHSFSAETIYWPNAEPFRLTKVYDGHTRAGFHYAANRYEAAEHGGTHMDAPIHFDIRGETVEKVGIDRLMGPVVVVNVEDRVGSIPDYEVMPEDFQSFEARHGAIPADSIVLIRTGYSRFWSDPARYLGTAERGEGAISKLHFPGLSGAGARWLITQRQVRAVGLDTASIDPGSSTRFESHRRLAAANVPIFENLKALAELPATGAYLMALPMKIEGGSGAPLRALAWIPDP